MARALEDWHAIVVCQTLDISTYFAYGAALLHEVLEQATDVDRKLGEGLALDEQLQVRASADLCRTAVWPPPAFAQASASEDAPSLMQTSTKRCTP